MFDFQFDAVRTQSDTAHSRYVQRIRRRYPLELAAFADACPGVPSKAAMQDLVAHLLSGGRELAAALRVARQLVIERLATQDVEGGAAMADIGLAMTHLAEVTLDVALAHAEAEARARHGSPVNAQGQVIDMWVVGMGKLGGRELNVSSDIDLVYVYEEDGETPGVVDDNGVQRGAVSAHEFFSTVARRLSTLIGDTTEDGFVFRVDLALRPNGNSGPPVVSLSMLEEYFQIGRAHV